MPKNILIASDFMSALPIYVSQKCTLGDTLNKIEEYKLSQITITDSNFATIGIITKKQIARFLFDKRLKRCNPMLKTVEIKELFDETKIGVVAYPATSIFEILDVMEVLKQEYIPIVKSPWNKILLGFISYKEIKGLLFKGEMRKTKA